MVRAPEAGSHEGRVFCEIIEQKEENTMRFFWLDRPGGCIGEQTDESQCPDIAQGTGGVVATGRGGHAAMLFRGRLVFGAVMMVSRNI